MNEDDQIKSCIRTPQIDDPATPVVIKLQIEHMRRQLYHMVQVSTVEMDKLIQTEVDKCVSQFRFNNQFYDNINSTIEHVVNEKVNKIVHDCMAKVFDDTAFRTKVAKLVTEKVVYPYGRPKRKHKATS